jgi:hypothetical protein
MFSPVARSFALVVLATSAVFLPSSLNAQASAEGRDSSAVRIADVTVSPDRSSVDSLSAAGPRVSRVGATAPVAIRSGLALPQGSDAQVGAGSNVAMMGVGAIVVGSLVGGDGGTIIAIGGGVIGLVGLYRYLR